MDGNLDVVVAFLIYSTVILRSLSVKSDKSAHFDVVLVGAEIGHLVPVNRAFAFAFLSDLAYDVASLEISNARNYLAAILIDRLDCRPHMYRVRCDTAFVAGSNAVLVKLIEVAKRNRNLLVRIDDNVIGRMILMASSLDDRNQLFANLEVEVISLYEEVAIISDRNIDDDRLIGISRVYRLILRVIVVTGVAAALCNAEAFFRILDLTIAEDVRAIEVNAVEVHCNRLCIGKPSEIAAIKANYTGTRSLEDVDLAKVTTGIPCHGSGLDDSLAPFYDLNRGIVSIVLALILPIDIEEADIRKDNAAASALVEVASDFDIVGMEHGLVGIYREVTVHAEAAVAIDRAIALDSEVLANDLAAEMFGTFKRQVLLRSFKAAKHIERTTFLDRKSLRLQVSADVSLALNLELFALKLKISIVVESLAAADIESIGRGGKGSVVRLHRCLRDCCFQAAGSACRRGERRSYPYPRYLSMSGCP